MKCKTQLKNLDQNGHRIQITSRDQAYQQSFQSGPMDVIREVIYYSILLIRITYIMSIICKMKCYANTASSPCHQT